MNSCDFEYDGYLLSDFGYTICEFDAAKGVVISNGADITFNTSTMNHGLSHRLTDASYSGCVETTFCICKDPESHSDDEMEIQPNEYRILSRWLNRRSFNRMRFIHDDDAHNRYYNASFNIGKITIDDKIFGLQLNMVTDSPFAYGALCERTFTVAANGSFIINNASDELGDTFPNITITCGAAGNLTLTNATTGDITVVNNCASGEVITIDGTHKLISSSVQSHKVFNDFNYEFPRIVSTITDRSNTFTSSLPCTVNISYYPVIRYYP